MNVQDNLRFVKHFGRSGLVSAIVFTRHIAWGDEGTYDERAMLWSK